MQKYKICEQSEFNSISNFSRNLGVDLYDSQLTVLGGYINNKLNIVNADRQVGITTLNIIYSLWACRNPLTKVAVVSNSRIFLKGIITSIVEKFVEKSEYLQIAINRRNLIQFSNGSNIHLMSDRESELFRGSTYDIIIIDNSAIIKNYKYLYCVINPILSSKSKFILINNFGEDAIKDIPNFPNEWNISKI